MIHKFLILLCFILTLEHFPQYACGKKVAMKMVDEPTNLGGVGYGGYNSETSHSDTLTMRITPSNFSGPQHLKLLYGKCFEKTLSEYKYNFCPFFNVSQHEQSLRWNPYNGILGVWQEWEIENNTFTAMMMREGDTCGSKYRSVRVLLQCGEVNGIEQVTEPETCKYQLVFITPYVCHPHAMLVYPTLNETLQEEWDIIEGQLVNEELTQQGYRKALHRVYEAAGYVIAEERKQSLSEAAKEKEAKQAERESSNFSELDTCNAEYKKLKEEIEGLRTLMQVNQERHNNLGGLSDYDGLDDWDRRSHEELYGHY